MECIFKGINKKNCTKFRSCRGIYQLITDLGGNKDFQERYSKYIWKRTLLNKFNDILSESLSGLFSILLFLFVKIFYPFLKIITGDPFGIEYKIAKVEKGVFFMEKSYFQNRNSYNSPMTYFTKVALGYSLFFKYAAIGAGLSIDKVRIVEKYGHKIGILVVMQDSFRDLKFDRIRSKFNPFNRWNNQKISKFVQSQGDNLKNEINIIQTEIQSFLIQNKIKRSLNIKSEFITSKTNSFSSMQKYAASTVSSFYACTPAPISNEINPSMNIVLKLILGLFGILLLIIGANPYSDPEYRRRVQNESAGDKVRDGAPIEQSRRVNNGQYRTDDYYGGNEDSCCFTLYCCSECCIPTHHHGGLCECADCCSQNSSGDCCSGADCCTGSDC